LMCDYLAGLQPDTGPMHDLWEHIGRLWTNGDPFLAYPVNSWTGWGHSSTRAAYIYQHRTSLRDKMIADEISRRVEAEQT
jgi:hypothetical protein